MVHAGRNSHDRSTSCLKLSVVGHVGDAVMGRGLLHVAHQRAAAQADAGRVLISAAPGIGARLLNPAFGLSQCIASCTWSAQHDAIALTTVLLALRSLPVMRLVGTEINWDPNQGAVVFTNEVAIPVATCLFIGKS